MKGKIGGLFKKKSKSDEGEDEEFKKPRPDDFGAEHEGEDGRAAKKGLLARVAGAIGGVLGKIPMPAKLRAMTATLGAKAHDMHMPSAHELAEKMHDMHMPSAQDIAEKMHQMHIPTAHDIAEKMHDLHLGESLSEGGKRGRTLLMAGGAALVSLGFIIGLVFWLMRDDGAKPGPKTADGASGAAPAVSLPMPARAGPAADALLAPPAGDKPPAAPPAGQAAAPAEIKPLKFTITAHHAPQTATPAPPGAATLAGAPPGTPPGTPPAPAPSPAGAAPEIKPLKFTITDDHAPQAATPAPPGTPPGGAPAPAGMAGMAPPAGMAPAGMAAMTGLAPPPAPAGMTGMAGVEAMAGMAGVEAMAGMAGLGGEAKAAAAPAFAAPQTALPGAAPSSSGKTHSASPVAGEPRIPGRATNTAAPTYVALPTPAPPAQPPQPMPNAPIPELLRKAGNLQLPTAAPDGREPWQAYAKPFKPDEKKGRIAIIVTGLGLHREATDAAIQRLPGEVSLAFSPYADRLADWVKSARASGHEVLLELPMEGTGFPVRDPGPMALFSALAPAENLKRLEAVLGRATSYTGVVALQGSRLMTVPFQVESLVRALKQSGLLLVDNGLAPDSVAPTQAAAFGLPFAQVKVVIDDKIFRDAIDIRLRKVEDEATAKGGAALLVHARPVTLERLVNWLKDFPNKGLQAVPVSTLAAPAKKS